MEFFARVTELSSAFREFVAPHYRPELYYMRGPGPAYRRRVAMAETRRQGPRFGGDATLAH